MVAGAMNSGLDSARETCVESYRRYSGEELLQLCRDGDTRAWEEIVARFGSLVYSVPLRLFDLPPEEADEVYQETFIVLLKQSDRIRDPEALSSWRSLR